MARGDDDELWVFGKVIKDVSVPAFRFFELCVSRCSRFRCNLPPRVSERLRDNQ